MAAHGQLSMLARGPLFDPQARRQYLADMQAKGVPQEAERFRALREWVVALNSDALTGAKQKETSLEQLFNQKVLGEVLGYSLYPGATASAWPKAPTSVTGIGGEPDVLLGSFLAGEEPAALAVLELKTPNTDLDAPQVGRKPPVSPVQQAFEYGERVLGVRWILVSDMQMIRLYSVESPHESIVFDLRRCAPNDGAPTPLFRELFWFTSHECLVEEGTEAPVARLLAKSASRQLAIRDTFYEVYYAIRADLISAVAASSQSLDVPPNRQEVLRATQRLLDRLIFLCYCEDSPDRLIPPDTVKTFTEGARRRPGPSATKVYEDLKLLFREIDAGSPPTAEIRLPGYNGELFKFDPIIDVIELPDSLHDHRYPIMLDGTVRHVQGVWGLHAFDFWRELNEHLLGHIFEQSLSDLQAMAKGDVIASGRMSQRKQHGIYYTSELLSNHLTAQSVTALLDEAAGDQSSGDDLSQVLEARQQKLWKLRIADMACGSGAFLVSSYQFLLEEFWSIRDGLDAMRASEPDLLTLAHSLTTAQLLRDTLHGADLLPQAVEIAKLALWLRSARKGEKVPDLSSNLVAADSLAVVPALAAMNAQLETFDLVVGNPPWGGEIPPDVYESCCAHLGLPTEPEWDSWELFVALGLALLRPGGRLAYVVPDTIFSPEKERTRRLILESGTLEYFHNLGTDWFDNVRMGTVVFQVRRGQVPMGHSFKALLLSGERRKEAIAGRVPLSQLVARFARDVPQDRCLASPTAEIEVFRSVQDDLLIEKMVGNGVALAELCDRGRGEEVNKAGVLWICPSCGTATVPGTKRKRDAADPDAPRYNPKPCPGCGLTLIETNVSLDYLVQPNGFAGDGAVTAPFIDGDDITRRYRLVVPLKELRLDFKGFAFKPPTDYADEKLLIRQAGVGLLASLDTTGARVPQSVYWYRLKPHWREAGLSHEFLLGVLLSRTMAFYIFKRFSEVDPARAHAKVTHERLSSFPIPTVDFGDPEQRRLHASITASVRGLLDADFAVGDHEDMQIDVALRKLWGLSPDDGYHVMRELAQLPEGQVIRDLFPNGIPSQLLDAPLSVPAGAVQTD